MRLFVPPSFRFSARLFSFHFALLCFAFPPWFLLVFPVFFSLFLSSLKISMLEMHQIVLWAVGKIFAGPF